jgi:hypothetical protein
MLLLVCLLVRGRLVKLLTTAQPVQRVVVVLLLWSIKI